MYLLSVRVHVQACVCTCVYSCLSFVWSLPIGLGYLATESMDLPVFASQTCTTMPGRESTLSWSPYVIFPELSVTKFLRVEKYHYSQ